MKTIKEAADSLLKKGEISQEDYREIEKSGAFELTKEALQSSNFLRGAAHAKSFFDVLKHYIYPAAVGGAGLVAGKELIYDPIKESIDINNSFKSMAKHTPQLEGKDEDQLKDYFSVVKTFSPKAASNPLVAGALVNKMMEFGGVDHKIVQDISAIQTGLQRPSIIQTVTEAAAKSVSPIPHE